ncbi:hypothetical protein OPV22_023762 [Ensete ventricosum]|uniref:SHSP domain-containing protein n=1 Tax=Ensete ventricosum TaxID=4639 RepID=A0AAV8PD76_ENSVE|nr:hypothetical protein OPV22_023762 [Ensete ventricosum]
MSIVRRSNVFDPFSLDLFDDPYILSLSESLPIETWAFANARIDWKEAHVFKADLPGVKRVEVEDGRVLQISGERGREEEEENEKWHRVERRSSGRFLRR